MSKLEHAYYLLNPLYCCTVRTAGHAAAGGPHRAAPRHQLRPERPRPLPAALLDAAARRRDELRRRRGRLAVAGDGAGRRREAGSRQRPAGAAGAEAGGDAARRGRGDDQELHF